MFLSGLEIDFTAFSGGEKVNNLAKWEEGTESIKGSNHHIYWNPNRFYPTCLLVCIYRING